MSRLPITFSLSQPISFQACQIVNLIENIREVGFGLFDIYKFYEMQNRVILKNDNPFDNANEGNKGLVGSNNDGIWVFTLFIKVVPCQFYKA